MQKESEMQVEYHYEDNGEMEVGFCYAMITMEDMEIDPVKIRVFVYGDDPEDYEADFLTEDMSYLKFGYVEIENLSATLYEVAEELIRRDNLLMLEHQNATKH